MIRLQGRDLLILLKDPVYYCERIEYFFVIGNNMKKKINTIWDMFFKILILIFRSIDQNLSALRNIPPRKIKRNNLKIKHQISLKIGIIEYIEITIWYSYLAVLPYSLYFFGILI